MRKRRQVPQIIRFARTGATKKRDYPFPPSYVYLRLHLFARSSLSISLSLPLPIYFARVPLSQVRASHVFSGMCINRGNRENYVYVWYRIRRGSVSRVPSGPKSRTGNNRRECALAPLSQPRLLISAHFERAELAIRRMNFK